MHSLPNGKIILGCMGAFLSPERRQEILDKNAEIDAKEIADGTRDREIANNLKALRKLVGVKAMNALKKGAKLFIWNGTVPSNLFIGFDRYDGKWLWHSSTKRIDLYIELATLGPCFEPSKDTGLHQAERVLKPDYFKALTATKKRTKR